MSDVRTMRWPKNCSRCHAEMAPGTELVEDQSNVGPRGGALFRHANTNECRLGNPYLRGSAVRSNPFARHNPSPFLNLDLPPNAASLAEGRRMLALPKSKRR